jgi:hypothetical protein
MDPTDETTGVTDAGMDGLLPLGRLEGNRVVRFYLPLIADFWGRILLRRQNQVNET